MSKINIDKTSKKDLTNIISIVLSLTTFPFIFVFYLLINKVLGLLVIPLTIGYLLTLLLNQYNKYDFARFNLIVWGSLALLIYGTFLGVKSHVLSVYAPFLFLPIVLFYPSEIKKRIIGTSIVFSSMITLKTFYLMNLNIINTNESISNLGEIIWLISCVLIVIFLIMLAREQIKYETELNKSYNKNIELIQEKKQTEITTLKKLITTLNHHINNLLVPITTGASIAQNKIEDKSLKKMLININENAFQISKIIKKISIIENITEKEYSDGSTMIDIESSIKENNTIVGIDTLTEIHDVKSGRLK